MIVHTTLQDEMESLRRVVESDVFPGAEIVPVPPLNVEELGEHVLTAEVTWHLRGRDDIANPLDAAYQWLRRASEIDALRYPEYRALLLHRARDHIGDASRVLNASAGR